MITDINTPACVIGVVIPCYRVKAHVVRLISLIGPEVSVIYAVDDCCPERTGDYLKEHCIDPRLVVLFHDRNKGVGGAMVTGFKKACADSCSVVIKLDGDGQMDPKLITHFAAPLLDGQADYVKGNRFFALESLRCMPFVRLVGNAALSFITKASTGYWNLMDPTNGYVAIRAEILRMLPLDKIDEGYFFESDMLFRLSTIRAVVKEVPMDAVYAEEESSLRVSRTLREFPHKHLNRFMKRIFYNYFLRDFNLCSLQIISGSAMLFGGTFFGLYHWIRSVSLGVTTPIGTVMLAALPVILGFQALLSAANFDVMNVPVEPVHKRVNFCPREPNTGNSYRAVS